MYIHKNNEDLSAYKQFAWIVSLHIVKQLHKQIRIRKPSYVWNITEWIHGHQGATLLVNQMTNQIRSLTVTWVTTGYDAAFGRKRLPY